MALQGIQSKVRRPMGCRNFHIAELTQENGDESTYSTPKLVKGLENFQYQVKYAEGSGYSDDIQDTVIKLPISMELSGIFAQYLPEIANLIQGNDISLGGRVVKTTDLQKEFAILYEVLNSDGTITYKIIYRSKLAVDGETNNTRGENIDFAKLQLTGKALPLSNGIIYREFNSSENLEENTIENFYKAVIAPNKKILQD